MKYFGKGKKRHASVALQAFHLKNSFPESDVKLYQNSYLNWKGQITPTPLSKTYHVQIKYRIGKRPDVTIIDPPLEPDENGYIPHVFHGKKLCLFMYKYAEWNGTMRIDETIMPWISLWLFHYEIWRATGEWQGGGEHPTATEKNENA